MWEKKRRDIRKRMEIHVARHSIERRLEQYTWGNRRPAQQTGIKFRLIKYVARS